MSRDSEVYIEDILESASLIENYLEGVSKETFLSDKGIQDKVIRRLEIIGEAAKNISEDIKNEYSGIPWREIAGMRDVLAHDYFGVDMKRIWRVANEDLPDLQKRLSKELD